MYAACLFVVASVTLVTGCLSTPPPAVEIDADVGSCVTGFDNGTFSGTRQLTSGHVALATGGQNGMFTSQVFASDAPRRWKTLAWTPVRPSLKALPDMRGNE